MKIVINKCTGGFGLSRYALAELKKLKGISPEPSTDDPTFITELKRNDPDLIFIVEKLGQYADSDYSSLEIIEIPDVDFEIIADDSGPEIVVEVGHYWK